LPELFVRRFGIIIIMPIEKPIKASEEIGPNYVFHLAALAEAGFSSDYAGKYAHSVKSEDLKWLRENADKISFGNGAGGDLVFPVLIFPAYLNLSTPDEFSEYFDLLGRGFKCSDFRDFMRRYRDAITRMQDWNFTDAPGEYFRELLAEGPAVERMGRIMAGNLPAYLSDVWPVEKPAIEAVCSAVNAFFAEEDAIGKWESFTGEKFKYPSYQILLCSALKNGPNADSLGYERNAFYSGTPFNLLTQLIVHETGTHILIDAPKVLYEEQVLADTDIYSAFECLCQFYTSKIIGGRPVYGMGAFGDEKYFGIYEKLFAEDPKAAPQDLIRRAVKAFRG